MSNYQGWEWLRRMERRDTNKVGRLQIPKTNLTLEGGRVLRYLGQQLPLPLPGMLEGPPQHAWKEEGGGDLAVIASVDPTRFGLLLHVSFSHPKKLPTWDELHQLKDLFYPPDVDAMQVLPRHEDYVNLHRFTLHLWQMPFRWGLQ